MPASALLLAASAGIRAASLNLCTDEYLLLLAEPRQIVGVSYLARDRRETALWRQAQRYPGNRGSIEDVLPLRPNLLLTSGGGGRATALLARRAGIRTVDVPYAGNLDGVAANLRNVAAALGNPARADPWLKRLDALRETAPQRAEDAVWISGGGFSLAPDSLGAQWLRLAGLRQRPLPGARATLEALLTKPPKIMIRSNYRSGEMSGGNRWLAHPIVQRAGARQLVTDGRPWTCVGPLMIPEIERLKRLVH
jgi:iron complex transport system substrate-binding protein